ncbi:MAG: hypothetical protein JXC36_03545 [Candidatus Atribacteria bacterium]|nr:hypothetical protein [Candidatus Atribacteria bacterium]
MEILFFSVAILSLLIDAIIAYQTLAPMFGFDLILFEKFDLALVQSLSIISNYLIGSALVFASLIGTLHLVGISDQNKKMKIFFFTWGIILLIATTFTLIMLANARYLASLVAESDVVDYNTLNRINIYNHYIYMGFTFASIMTNCIAVLAFRNGSIIMGSSILWLLIALVFVLIWAVSVLINIIINAIFIFFVSIFWLLVTLVGGKRDENHEELQDIHAGNNSEIENNKNNPQNENVNNENEYDDSSLEESEDQLLEISDETDNEDQELKWDPF